MNVKNVFFENFLRITLHVHVNPFRRKVWLVKAAALRRDHVLFSGFRGTGSPVDAEIGV